MNKKNVTKLRVLLAVLKSAPMFAKGPAAEAAIESLLMVLDDIYVEIEILKGEKHHGKT